MSKNKEKDAKDYEVEEYFKEVKNRSFPTGLIFLVLIILMCSTISYYYFVVDSPKNVFLTVINDVLSNIDYKQHEKINYEFSLNTNMETTNKENAKIVNIIEEIALTGNGGIDLKNIKNYSKLNTFYKGDTLLTVDAYLETDNLYFKLDKLYDKVIKVSSDEEAKQEQAEEIEELTPLIKTLKETIIDNLNNASYQKKYVDLNDVKVKKVTLLINKKFLENLYLDLLESDNFIETYSKLTNKKTKEVTETINKLINKLDDETIKVSLYLSILENKFIMLETINKEEQITITKENNKYNYKIYNDSIIEYQGYAELIKNNNDYDISISVDDVKEELAIIFNIDLSLDYEKDIDSLDTTNNIDYEKLTDNDISKIKTNLYKNKTFISLYQDIVDSFKKTTNTENKLNQTT